ncbi:MAG: hypothetical protein ACRENP_11210 [Longimicrobiales bacterium]
MTAFGGVWNRPTRDFHHVQRGVTGRRSLGAIAEISAGIDAALDAIERRFPTGPVAVLSSLAEGADRLVVQRARARPRPHSLIAVLPLPEQDYVRDFKTAESRAEFAALLRKATQVLTLPHNPNAPRNEAYWAAGQYILDHGDVLLAVWDGQPGRGRGGTADVVAAARARGTPLVWVHTGSTNDGRSERNVVPGTETVERL